MKWDLTNILRAACAAGALAATLAATPASAASDRALFISLGSSARAPVGWTEFCAEYAPECETKAVDARDVLLTAKAWKDLVRINDLVNDKIKPVTDLEHWGVAERWNYPDDGYGDCEDYVLLKRRMLMQAGWPRQALLITVVRDKQGDGHAVLTVKTDKGEFILDNQNEQVLLWSETGYRFVKRQSQTDPNAWIALGDTAPGRRHRHVTLMAPHPGLRKADHPHATPDRICTRPAPLPGDRPPVFSSSRWGGGRAASGVRSSPRRSAECHPTRLSPFAYCCQRRT